MKKEYIIRDEAMTIPVIPKDQRPADEKLTELAGWEEFGVAIKGMTMPITCCYCPLMFYDAYIEWNDNGRDTVGAYCCKLTRELINNTKREDHCPLVQLHEPPQEEER